MVLQPVAELDLDEFDRMHRTNVRGPFVVARGGRSPARRWRHRHLLHNALTCRFICVLVGAAVLLLIARQALEMSSAVAASGGRMRLRFAAGPPVGHLCSWP
ncbi:hypothetical protein ACIBCL_19345 [Micromonospora zamorensis]|uniref:hypothetical protein n=1 Tax=Micromonospora zamorensis TaxID=709883 RepID=UPI003799211D